MISFTAHDWLRIKLVLRWIKPRLSCHRAGLLIAQELDLPTFDCIEAVKRLRNRERQEAKASA